MLADWRLKRHGDVAIGSHGHGEMILCLPAFLFSHCTKLMLRSWRFEKVKKQYMSKRPLHARYFHHSMSWVCCLTALVLMAGLRCPTADIFNLSRFL